MFRLIKLLIILTVFALAAAWLINNNGEVVINWLGYEIITDMLMIVVLSLCFIVLVFIIFALFLKLFSFKIGFLKNRLGGKKYEKKLQKIERENEEAFSLLTKILALLDEEKLKSAKKEYKKFAGLVKNKDIIEYLEFRFGYFESDAYNSKRSKKIAENTPGSSPSNDKDSEQYFTFATDKGWSK